MEGDLRLRGLSEVTHEEYLRRIRQFLAYYEVSPEQLSADDVRRYMLHLVDNLHVGPANLKTTIAAIKFLYNVTLDRPEVVARVKFPKVPLKLLDIPSPTEVAAVLTELESPVYRTLLFCAYGAGLRVSEACNLCVGDIDSKRMVIIVRHGKGGRDRYAVLSPVLLEALRSYYRQVRPPQPYLFQGKFPGKPVPVEGVQTALRMALQRSGVSKRITPHTLRHAFATHSLEAGTDLRVIQTLLGHANIHSTVRYVHVSTRTISKTRSPFDAIATQIDPQLAPKPDANPEAKNPTP
jgi:site-specific recombinase XerD